MKVDEFIGLQANLTPEEAIASAVRQLLAKRGLTPDRLRKHSFDDLCEALREDILPLIKGNADKWDIVKQLKEVGINCVSALKIVNAFGQQPTKMRSKRPSQQPSSPVRPNTEPEKYLRPLVAWLFIPGLHLCLLLTQLLIFAWTGGMLCFLLMGVYRNPDLALKLLGIAALTIVGASIGLGTSVKAAFRAVSKAEFDCNALTVTKEQVPWLLEIISSLCSTMGTDAPDRVLVELGVNVFVTEAKVKTLDGAYTSRTLCIGAPLLHLLSKAELKAVIAHELAHFKGNDAVYSRRFYPVYRGATFALTQFRKVVGAKSFVWLSLRFPLVLPMLLLLGYVNIFRWIEGRISRRRELRADHIGAVMSSPEIMASALIKVHAYSALWCRVAEISLVDSLSEGKVFRNMALAFSAACSSKPALISGMLGDGSLCLSHPTDSHPPLNVRLGALGQPNRYETAGGGDAVEVTSALTTLEERLTEKVTSIVARYHPGVDHDRWEKALLSPTFGWKTL